MYNPLRYFTAIQNLRRVVNSELIQVIIPAGTTRTKFQLPDQQNLRNVKLMGIVAYTLSEVPVSIIGLGGLVSLAQLKSCFLTLQAYNGENFSWQVPLIALRNMGDGLTTMQSSPRVFNNQRVNYPKSYIEIADISIFPPIGTPDVVVLLEVFYIHSNKKQRKQDAAEFRKQS